MLHYVAVMLELELLSIVARDFQTKDPQRDRHRAWKLASAVAEVVQLSVKWPLK